MKKETIGSLALREMQKAPLTRSVIEITNEMKKQYIPNLIECVEINKKKFPGDFFIEVIIKNEPLMWNVFKDQFMAKKDCPTPNYDQDVYRYNSKDESIEYIWSVPCRDACYHLKDNALIVAPEERQLLKMVLDFADGTLYKLCKKLNNEEDTSPLIVKG